jgi:hypothetical protein
MSNNYKDEFALCLPSPQKASSILPQSNHTLNSVSNINRSYDIIKENKDDEVVQNKLVMSSIGGYGTKSSGDQPFLSFSFRPMLTSSKKRIVKNKP